MMLCLTSIWAERGFVVGLFSDDDDNHTYTSITDHHHALEHFHHHGFEDRVLTSDERTTVDYPKHKKELHFIIVFCLSSDYITKIWQPPQFFYPLS